MRAVLGQMEEGFLDLDGIARAGGSSERLAPLLEAWEEGKLMERSGSRYHLTLAGQFWQVNLAQMLLTRHSGADGEAAGFPARAGAGHPHAARAGA
jgi:hypothetical protein